MARYTTEKHIRVYNDDTGEYYTIRPDADGLGQVQLEWTDPRDASCKHQFLMPVSVARLVSSAILENFTEDTYYDKTNSMG